MSNKYRIKFITPFWILLFCWHICALASSQKVMKSHLSSAWYPQDAQLLLKTITELNIRAAQQYGAHLDASKICALVVPHAGYAYSGAVAAATYRTIAHSKNISRIIILAPSHYEGFVGVRLPTYNRYRLSGGEISLDVPMMKKLVSHSLFVFDDQVFNKEHSLEVQLPFIQHYCGNVSVVPLMVGNLTETQIRLVAQTLAPLINEKTLVVVSTDFTHYGTQFDYTPFVDHIAERIRQLDAMLITAVQQQQVNPFLSIIKNTHATVCGRMPLAIFLSLCEQQVFGEIESRLIAYATSSNTAETGSSVSYGGLAFTRQKRRAQAIEDQFTMMEQQVFLDLGKRTVRSLFDRAEKEFLLPLMGTAGFEKRGVFVTLKKQGNLRGCIGIVEPVLPLSEGIIAQATSAALHDSRFFPVTVEELPDIEISLSILGLPAPVSSYRQIVLAKQGIILKLGNKHALFLPKVASEFGWNLKTTLTELAKKAGLSALAWKNPKTEFFVFTSLDTASEPVDNNGDS